jgi:outer membrane protein assembly factor BamB
MLELLLAIALSAGALSNFPRDAGGKITAPAIGIALDGTPVVVVAAGDQVVAYRADGGSPPGFPIRLGDGEVAVGAPAAADMDGSRRLAVAAVTASGKVVLSSGGVVPGWPVSLGARARAGVAFADVDGDGHPELVVGDERGRLHAFKRNGVEVKGFPVTVARGAITSSVSSAQFAGGLSLAVGSEDGRLHVVNGAGRPRPGFPIVTGFAVTGAPAFADLADDGTFALIFTSQDFKLYAVNGSGQALPGFPVTAGYRIYEGPAIADLDHDGHLDVVFASADGLIHAVDRAGRPLPGFPVKVSPRIFSGPAVGDLDRDGSLEVVVAGAEGTLLAVSASGRPLPGFPVNLGEPDQMASPLLFDLAGDGSLSAFVGTPAGKLHAVRATRASSPVATAAVPWRGPGHGANRDGRYGPNPPGYKSLVLSPPSPHVTDRLVASWRPVWLDAAPGEAVPPPRLEWRRDGKAVPGLDGKKELPAGTARRGEHWRFVLTAPSGEGTPAEGPEVVVLDTAPTVPEVRVDPTSPVRGGTVKAVIAKPSTDLDGDGVAYRIDWLIDGLETGVTGDLFPGDRLRRGMLLTARVLASDGELEAAPALADARVANTPPGAPVVALGPAAPRRTDAIEVKVVTEATDPDEDPVTYHYRWSLDGRPLPLPLTVAALPAGLARKHQKVGVEVRAFDGEAEGPVASAAVAVVNSPPGAPRVEISPARPRKGEPLHVALLAPGDDPDGDSVSATFAWTKNGKPFTVTGDGREVPGGEVSRGDRFEVTVTPSDGEMAGPTATAAVTVVNTPPETPRVAIEPRHPKGGDTLKLVVLEPAKDADGDQVELRVAWTREGASTGGGEATLPPGAYHKHERVRVVVTPHDGQEAGVPATDEVTVDNAPPGAPELGFESAHPTVTAPLKVAVVKPATDPDGDAVRYRYRWRRQGSPVLIEGGKPLGDGTWTEASEVPASLLKKGEAWEVEAQAFDGEVYGPSARSATVIANSPPPPPQVSFRPDHPRRVDGLSIDVAQAKDADGDLITYRYLWSRNGQKVDLPPDQAQIPRGMPKRGEKWAVEVVALDGESESPPARAETVIADTAPTTAGLALCDGPVPSGTVPEVRVATPSTDADGDAVAYRYAWTLDGQAVPGASGARFVRPLRKHEVARVEVTPFDGELTGPTSTAECTARNTPPAAPVVVLDPTEPTALTGLMVHVERPAADRDGDPVSYRYLWTRDGLPVQLEGPVVPPRTLRHREVWRVEVVPSDGEEEGERVVLSATVRNTPPPTPAVVVKPLAPTVGEILTCETAVPDRDADQEVVTVHYRWARNDKPVALSEGLQTVPAAVVKKGERWRCEAWSSDGTSESGRAVAEVTVQNSPPSAPTVVIEPDPAHRTDDLSCRVSVPSVDPDGDEVSYTFAWWRNEKPLPPMASPAVVPAAQTNRGDRFRCAATPSDGSLSGPSATAALIISNSPPTPARVRLSPQTPTIRQPVRCEVVTKSVDPDGDAVRYRFRWEKDGAVQPFSETTDEVPSRMLKPGDRWRCFVTSTDGDDDGVEAASEEGLVGVPP